MSDLGMFLGFGDPVPWKVALFSLLLAFALSQLVGAVYALTFRGMSYSRSLVQTVAVGSIVACTLMLAINNSIAAGLGIAGSLAIIRFRTAMRDPRDMLFVFASMGAGIASGLRAYAAAIAGTLVFCVAAAALSFIEYGSQRQFDGLLRFQLPVSPEAEEAVARILREHTRFFALVALKEASQGQAMEHAYHVRLGHPRDRAVLLVAVQSLPGVRDASLLLQEPTEEL